MVIWELKGIMMQYESYPYIYWFKLKHPVVIKPSNSWFSRNVTKIKKLGIVNPFYDKNKR